MSALVYTFTHIQACTQNSYIRDYNSTFIHVDCNQASSRLISVFYTILLLTHTNTYTLSHTHTHARTHTHTHTHTHSHTHTHIHTHTHTHTHSHTHTHTHTHTHALTYTHILTYTHTSIQTNLHTTRASLYLHTKDKLILKLYRLQ